MPKVCGIYKITSPVGRVYIGQSVDCWKRAAAYRRGESQVQIRLHRSILKYGWAAHVFEIIHVCPREGLNDLEKEAIKKFDSFDTAHGLNLKAGGNYGGSPSVETRIKIGLAHKGNRHSLGKKHSLESKIKHSLASSGEKNPMFGRKIKGDHLQKIIAATRGKKKTGTHLENIRKNHHRRPVGQYSKGGILIKEWSSAKEAAKFGYNYTVIRAVCAGIGKSHANFKWLYHD